jgi:hypothetical protein
MNRFKDLLNKMKSATGVVNPQKTGFPVIYASIGDRSCIGNDTKTDTEKMVPVSEAIEDEAMPMYAWKNIKINHPEMHPIGGRAFQHKVTGEVYKYASEHPDANHQTGLVKVDASKFSYNNHNATHNPYKYLLSNAIIGEDHPEKIREDIVGSHYNHTDTLSDNHKNIISSYMEEDYDEMNRHLYQKAARTLVNNRPSTDLKVNTLNNVLSTYPALNRDITVYTGVSRKNYIDAKRKAGNGVLHLPAFTSTSLYPEVAMRYAADSEKHCNDVGFVNDVMKITIPKGTRHGGFVNNLSQTPHEDEFLLKNNRHVKIDSEPKIYHSSTGQSYKVYNAKLMNDDEIEQSKKIQS